jgi:hypothetical protein
MDRTMTCGTCECDCMIRGAYTHIHTHVYMHEIVLDMVCNSYSEEMQRYHTGVHTHIHTHMHTYVVGIMKYGRKHHTYNKQKSSGPFSASTYTHT